MKFIDKLSVFFLFVFVKVIWILKFVLIEKIMKVYSRFRFKECIVLFINFVMFILVRLWGVSVFVD